MENNIQKNEQSFLHLAQQRENSERMRRFYSEAVGDEDTSRRQENIKHFNMGANRYQAVVFSEPVHFRESDNEDWQEIDNTLEATVNAHGRKVLRNRANRVKVEFPQQMDGGNMVSITSDGKTFSWRFEKEAKPVQARVRSGAQLKQERLVKQAQKLPKFVGRTVESLKAADLAAELETEQERRADIAELNAENTYNDILPGVSVRYMLSSERVKEDIILADADALAYAALRLPKDFDYTVAGDKQLLVREKGTDKVVFTMNAPLVYDAQDAETMADVVLTDCTDYIRLAYVIDPEYLASAVFPVTIDPVINSTAAVYNIQDTTLTQGSSATPYADSYLKIGTSNSKRNVALLKFNQLARLTSSDTVIQAVLQMAPKSSSASKYIGCYEVLKPWSSTTVSAANFNPDLATNISYDALECIPGSSNTWLAFDLTNVYRKWCMNDASGNSQNHGIAMRTPLNVSGDNYSELYSSDGPTSYRPVMYVSYISHAGIEGWWQYEQMGAGRAGTVYSDLFNGNMVLEHSDTVMTGNRNPVSVNHYYNSCKSNVNAYACGYGWKTDAHQKVTARDHNSRRYLVWEDGDGTEHFFDWSGSQPYKDTEGMELEMTFSSDNKTIFIYDKEHNGLRFKVVQAGLGWLEATTDACGNISVYSYVSGGELTGRLAKITDPVGRETVFSYTNDLLTSIRIPAAEDGTYRYVYYTYDNAKRLTGVRYSELGGTTPHTTYGYDGATMMLTKARNYDGIQVNVGYEPLSVYNTSVIQDGLTDQMRRVLSLETVATNSAGTVQQYGAKQLFEYGTMTTEVTAVEDTTSDAGKKLYYQFNDSGNVVCVRDELGFAKFTKFSSGIENKPSQESKLRKAIVNRLRRPDFNSQWTAVTAGGTATKDTTTTCLNASSMKMVKTGTGEVIYRQQVALEAGTPFTLSAYLKTSALASGGAFLRIKPVTTGAFATVKSDVTTGTTDAAIGNELPTDGWERIRVTMDKLTTAAQAYVELVCNAQSGTAWFACPQLETGVVANAFNLVSNGDFRYTTTSGVQTLPSDWNQGANNLKTATTGVFAASTDSTFPAALEGNYVQVEGAPNKNLMGFMQYIDLAGKAGDIYVVGGWADGKSVPNATTYDKGFTLGLSLKKKSDGTWITPVVYPFNGEWVGWQQNCYATAAAADYTQIAIFVVYSSNCNIAKFSNIFLHREAYGTTFGYDDKGNVLSTSNLAGQQSKATYDSADNEITYVQPGRDNAVADNQYWAYFGATDADKKKHLPWRIRTPMHVMDYFTYDSYGNTTASRRVDYRVYTGNTADNAYPYIRTENTYTSDGNYTATTKDARGNIVTQIVNIKDSTLTSVTDPAGQTMNYAYDDSKRVTSVQTTDDGKTYKNSYTYENDQIKTVSHNTTSNTFADVNYTFDYDNFGRKTTVKVGTQTLSTNVYQNDRDGLLSEVQYSNGGKVKYAYDDFDRLTEVRHDNETTPRYVYKYGANGVAAEVEDRNLGRLARTDYDQADRPCQTELRDVDTSEAIYKTHLKYDKLNHLEQFTERVGGEMHTSKYTYDRDNRVTGIAFDGTTHKIDYTYDELDRLSKREVASGADTGKLTSTYSYVNGGYGTNSTTSLVSSIAQNGISFEYNYDSCGNIISEKRGTLTTTYSYDALGQLIRVNDPHENATWVYNYDRGGNITSKVKYAYTTGTLGTVQQTIPYTYSDANWKDKLTAYNGQVITYDAIGNPLNDGMWTYEWAAGRQLKCMSREGQAVSFKYDHNGMRTQKVLEHDWYPETTNYTLHGKLITHMTFSYTDANEIERDDNLHFFYDQQSRVSKVDFNGTMYSYIHNLQGDIVGILDNSGSLIVEYKYDAWGKLLMISGPMATTLGKTNPFRYRGYAYDEETGLYYLRSRYYAPDWCRYLIPDVYYSTGQGALCCNRYCYCANNSIIAADYDGDLFMLLTAAIGAAVGAVIGGVKAAKNGENILKGVLIGGAIGGAAGLGVGAVAGIVLAGSATASTLAVTTGAKTVAYLLTTGSVATGGAFIVQNMRNFLSNITVLGRYPKYIEIAQQLKSRLFNYPMNIWNQLTPAQQYQLNMEFLKYATTRNQVIHLSANAYSARAGSAFATEIQYLLSQGYRIINEGWSMVR